MLVVGERYLAGQNILQTSSPAMAALIRGQAVEYGAVGGALQVHVERGVNSQAALVDLIAAVLAFQVAADFLDKIRRQRIGIVGHFEADGLIAGRRRLLRRDLAVFEHRIDHQVAALQGAVRMRDGRIVGRRFGQAGEQRGFVEGQSFRRLAEVKLGSGLESVDAVAEINLVGVEGENLWLGETPLDLHRQQRFLNLAMKGAVRRKKKIARQLHGQGRGALHPAAGLDVAVSRPGDAPDIDAPVPVEVLVFDRNQSLAQDLRIVVITGHHPALQRERPDGASLIVVEFGDGTGAVMFELINLWQIGGVDEQQSGGRSHQSGDQHQQADDEAAHHLVLGGRGLRRVL